jgi:hypothetical protein
MGYSRIPESDLKDIPSYRGSVQEHLRLLQGSESVLKELALTSKILEISKPMLLHPDYNKRNIFVSEADPTVVTSLIDWQFASIEPVFHYADDNPDFLFLHDDIERLVTTEVGEDANPEVRR